jgi:hypothetical protein
MKKVFSLSSEYIEIWWYPELESKKLKNSKLVVESTNLSIFRSGKLSFGQTLFRLVMSTHILHFPVFFFTITILSNQSGYMTLWINPAINSLSISTVIVYCLSPKFLFFCWIRRKVRSNWSLWVAIFGLIPDIFEVLKAKSDLQVWRKYVSNFYWGGFNVESLLVTA